MDKLWIGAWKNGCSWRLTDDPEVLMNGEDQILCSSWEELRDHLSIRHPAPSDKTTYLGAGWGHGKDEVMVFSYLMPTEDSDLVEAARSAPGHEIHPVRNHVLPRDLGDTRLNSNRGVIGDDILVRYDARFIVFDPELVASELIRIKKLKGKREGGAHKKWAKGEFRNGDLKPYVRELEFVLAHILSEQAGRRIPVSNSDHRRKGQWIIQIHKYLVLLLKLTTLEELDQISDSNILKFWISARDQLRLIGEHFKLEIKDSTPDSLKALKQAIELVTP